MTLFARCRRPGSIAKPPDFAALYGSPKTKKMDSLRTLFRRGLTVIAGLAVMPAGPSPGSCATQQFLNQVLLCLFLCRILSVRA